MQQVTLKGEIVMVDGEFPKAGEQARGFMLVDKELRDVSLSQWSGKRKVLNIVPSIDTPTCQAQARRFNEYASSLPNTVVLVISADLPFAQSRFCGVEGLDNVITLSTLRGRDFQRTYGVLIAEPPLQGLCARAVIVLDESDKVLYAQLVNEITSEPDYDKAIAALKQ